MKPRVAISLGDPCGVGPEVTLRALLEPSVREQLVPVVFGDVGVWQRTAALVGADPELPICVDAASVDPERGGLVRVTDLGPRAAPLGGGTEASGRAQIAYLERAVDALGRGETDALCTAPVTKAAIPASRGGFTGHTEYLRDRLGAGTVAMMLAGPRLRVTLVTTHLALAEVPAALSEEKICEIVRLTEAALRSWFGVERPRVAVCGLNPHAGERGLFGREEIEIIGPAVEALVAERLEVFGPIAADAAMPRAVAGEFDAVVAMYHDQGLGPVKTLHFDEAVNVTLGLPVPRTSPDHGSALDIAAQGIARPGAMISALTMAARLASGQTL